MKHIAVLGACVVLPALLGAQAVAMDPALDRLGLSATEVWAGYSNSSSQWGFLGNRPGMSFGIAGLRYTRRFRSNERYAVEYTFDIIPYAISSPPLDYDEDENGVKWARLRPPCAASGFRCRFPSGSAQGAGFSPLGLTAVYRRDKFFQPRIGMTGGALLFDRRIPTVVSTRFNFTTSVEAGAQFITRGGRGAVFTYRFHHLSNAGTGEDNSALASHVLSVGLRWRNAALGAAK